METPSSNRWETSPNIITILALLLSGALSHSALAGLQDDQVSRRTWRVMLAVEDASIRPVQVWQFPGRAPPSDALESRAGRPACAYHLEDADGRILYRRIFPGFSPGEVESFPAARGKPAIHRLAAPDRGQRLMCLIPDIPAAKDLVIVGYRPDPGNPGVSHPPTRIPMQVMRDMPLTPERGAIVSPAVTKVVDHGDGRWDLVILSEGFRSGDLPQFAAETWNFVQQLWGTPPFDEVWNAINVYRVDVISNENGADDPKGCPGASGIDPDTAFDASFCTLGEHHVMTMDTQDVINLVSVVVPSWDMALVMVNSSSYGGGEWPELGVGMFTLGQSSDGTPAWETGVHEIGHAFTLLDEYESAGSWNPAFGEPSEPNVTMNSDPATVKWSALITTSPPPKIVCSSNPSISPYPPATVGLFEGALNVNCGLFRSSWICKMRHHGYPFCAVCCGVIEAKLQKYLP